ncbi:hypothetical protein PTKIN_Ptkin03bG0161100 [Pterospermum kingtungense]
MLQATAAQTRMCHLVGDELGWLVPPGGPIAYSTWAAMQTFTVPWTNAVPLGQKLAINVSAPGPRPGPVPPPPRGPITYTVVLTTSPANITLTTTGEHFFTSTLPRHCDLGQTLAINVTASSMANPPSSSTEPPSSGTSPVSEGPSESLQPRLLQLAQLHLVIA